MRLDRNRWIACCGMAGLLIVAGMPPATGQRAALVPDGRGCVWKVSAGAGTVYLAGSVHLLREEDFPLPEVFDAAYAGSDELVFEVDMEFLSSPEAAATMQRAGTLPPGTGLADLLGEDTFARLREYFLSRGVSFAAFHRLKPGMVFLTISSLEAMRLGARGDLGLESHYYRRSVEDGKPSRGLETIEQQLALFDDLTETEVDTLIRQTLDDIDEMPETIARMIDVWKSGDIRGLADLLDEQFGKDERMRKLLLTDRNRDWIPEIEKALAGERNVLFIVGAAHLVGKGSVIELLEEKGRRVERLRPKAKPARFLPGPSKKAA